MTNKEASATLSVFQEDILNNLWLSNEQRKGLAEAIDVAIKTLEERPQGEWITRETPEGTTYLIECPVCGYQKGNKWVVFTALPPYCECCGAKLGTDNETHD